MLGLATGCIGMGLEDFERCTPSEFRAIADAWREHRSFVRRESWEEVRTLAWCLLQSMTERRLKMTDVLSFAWDEEAAAGGHEELPEEDVMGRYAAVMKARGLR